MTLLRHQNIPARLHQDDREIVAFFQNLLDYAHGLIQTGTRISWKSTATPSGGYLQLNGAVITNSQYPDLVAYARNDATFTVGATTTTLPTEANTWIKT
jgi:hypothetical protein